MIFCFIASVLGAGDLGIQGNGNLIPTGVLLGCIFGVLWSTVLMFALWNHFSRYSRKLQTITRIALTVFGMAALVVSWNHVNPMPTER